jgi:hypothetical protein
MVYSLLYFSDIQYDKKYQTSNRIPKYTASMAQYK